jgi:hypothetical protein
MHHGKSASGSSVQIKVCPASKVPHKKLYAIVEKL